MKLWIKKKFYDTELEYILKLKHLNTPPVKIAAPLKVAFARHGLCIYLLRFFTIVLVVDKFINLVERKIPDVHRFFKFYKMCLIKKHGINCIIFYGENNKNIYLLCTLFYVTLVLNLLAYFVYYFYYNLSNNCFFESVKYEHYLLFSSIISCRKT